MNRTIAPAWLAAIGTLAGVIALWEPGTFQSLGTRHRLLLNPPEWVLAVLAVASLTVLLAIVSLLIAMPRRKEPSPSETKSSPALRLSLLASLVLALLLGSLATTGMLAVRLLAAWLGGNTEMTAPSPLSQDEASGPDIIQISALNLAITVALAILAAVLIGFSLLVILLNQPWVAIAGWFRHPTSSDRLDDVASAISAAAHELEHGDDPRRAVIACYRRCETAFASRRRRRYNSETPREFVRDTLTALVLPENAVRSLLSVFERARFSDLPITQTDRSIAVDALTEIRSVLESENRDGAHP